MFDLIAGIVIFTFGIYTTYQATKHIDYRKGGRYAFVNAKSFIGIMIQLSSAYFFLRFFDVRL